MPSDFRLLTAASSPAAPGYPARSPVIRPPTSGRSLKVAIATDFPRDPSCPVGGVEAVGVNLVGALTKHEQLEVHVVTADFRAKAPETSSWSGAVIHRLPRSGRLLHYAVTKGRRQLLAYLARLRPDLVHAHDFYGLMVKGLGCPRVFTIHGFIHEDTHFAGGAFGRLRAQLWRWVETAGWAEQPHIISISPYVRERLHGIARGVIHDVENPIDPGCFQVQRKERPGTVFCAAALHPRKNTLGLIDAFAQLVSRRVDARLRLAGTVSDPRYEEEVLDRIKVGDLGNRVTLLGSISTQQVRDELAQASVFALLSFEEGAPMGIAEAMAAGVPVVSSNRCGMPYMVRSGETGFLVNPHDPKEAARRLEDLIANAPLRCSLAARAQQAALQMFHPDQVAERTIRVYREIIADCSPARQ